MSKFRTLLSRHAGASLARQIAFGDVIGDAAWEVDMGAGVIAFGVRAFSMQVLGTEAEGDQSWLWGWANAASGIPEPLLRSASELRAFGKSEGIDVLSERSFPLARKGGHELALFASGINGSSAYYRAPYDGGALYVLVTNPGVPPVRETPDERVPTILAQMLQMFDLDHGIATRSFLHDAGFTVEDGEGELDARRGATALTLTFDEQGRLSNIDGKLTAG